MLTAAAVTVLALAAAPRPAPAENPGNTPNWPELLPPNPNNSAAMIDPGFDLCPGGAIRCPEAVIRQMYKRWRPLSQTCDHRAVFAMTYLRTTEEFLRTVKAQPGFFDDVAWINHEDAVFAEFYFRAFDRWEAGQEVPAAWRVAFETAESPDQTGIGDLLLGMNAHINRDLPYTLAAVGLVPPGGGSRKTDHDRVNFFLERVADPLQEELGRRYDELFRTTDAEPSPFDELSVLHMVRGFRQNAWQNAERLVNAQSDAERAQVAASIEAEAESSANSIRASNSQPGYGPQRDRWCRDHNPPPHGLRVRDRWIGRVLRTGLLRVAVSSDGPARLRLVSRVGRREGAAEAAAPSGVVALAQARVVRFSAAQTRRVELVLTGPGRRLLASRQRVRARVSIRAPRGVTGKARRTLRRGGA